MGRRRRSTRGEDQDDWECMEPRVLEVEGLGVGVGHGRLCTGNGTSLERAKSFQPDGSACSAFGVGRCRGFHSWSSLPGPHIRWKPWFST